MKARSFVDNFVMNLFYEALNYDYKHIGNLRPFKFFLATNIMDMLKLDDVNLDGLKAAFNPRRIGVAIKKVDMYANINVRKGSKDGEGRFALSLQHKKINIKGRAHWIGGRKERKWRTKIGGSSGYYRRDGFTFDVGSSVMFGFSDKEFFQDAYLNPSEISNLFTESNQGYKLDIMDMVFIPLQSNFWNMQNPCVNA
ncbi:hypothetical protein E2562_034590 [Oryza meyeriana var. granulata]|uniref:Uncharacterized protein n=1 Tax=Oryza meyeriana var. granulata TaxID=110450 RepID=A0A6G1DQU5_9ORYZ|nr:hypothetical protein E2562_034590 [Oryza meyeriana var. granulata]